MARTVDKEVRSVTVFCEFTHDDQVLLVRSAFQFDFYKAVRRSLLDVLVKVLGSGHDLQRREQSVKNSPSRVIQ